MLSWSPLPSADAFWVYGADNDAYFVPGFAPNYLYRLVVLAPDVTTWSSGNGVGDLAHNWTYLDSAADEAGQEIGRSNLI